MRRLFGIGLLVAVWMGGVGLCGEPTRVRMLVESGCTFVEYRDAVIDAKIAGATGLERYEDALELWAAFVRGQHMHNGSLYSSVPTKLYKKYRLKGMSILEVEGRCTTSEFEVRRMLRNIWATAGR